MSIRQIVQMSSPADAAARERLRRPTRPVDDFGDAFQSLVDDLLDTLAAHPIAIGLAAPQIGSELRVAVVHLKTEKGGGPIVLVNPRIVSTSGKKDIKKESCMSVPHFRGPVERRHKIIVECQDRTGKPLTIRAESFLARVIAHEADHLDGLLYLDRMSDQRLLEPANVFAGDSKLNDPDSA